LEAPSRLRRGGLRTERMGIFGILGIMGVMGVMGRLGRLGRLGGMGMRKGKLKLAHRTTLMAFFFFGGIKNGG